MANETQANAPKQPTRYALVCVLCKTESPAFTVEELRDDLIPQLWHADLFNVAHVHIKEGLERRLTDLGWDCRKVGPSHRKADCPYCHRCARFA